MSVLLVIERDIDGATTASTHPLSTEDVFNEIWLQGAEKIEAQWIPLFSSAVTLDPDDIPAVCGELRALHKWAATELPHPIHQHLAARIKMAIEALQTAISCVP